MKKLICLLLVTAIAIVCVGCNDGYIKRRGTIDITEKLYVTYINEIYTNTEDYIGRTIKIQGMFAAEQVEDNSYYYVYRVGPGCCGNDGNMCGFEFTTNNGYPESNDWIEVVGKLRTYEENGNTFLTLDAESVTVMEERGLEVVQN